MKAFYKYTIGGNFIMNKEEKLLTVSEAELKSLGEILSDNVEILELIHTTLNLCSLKDTNQVNIYNISEALNSIFMINQQVMKSIDRVSYILLENEYNTLQEVRGDE